MRKFLWRIGYTVRLFRSPYPFNLIDSWQESGDSWDHHIYFTPDFGLDFPTPAQALYDDQTEWRDW